MDMEARNPGPSHRRTGVLHVGGGEWMELPGTAGGFSRRKVVRVDERVALSSQAQCYADRSWCAKRTR
jgi:hypothetical protein